MTTENCCEGMKDLLSALMDDELDAGRRKFVGAHLLSCSNCSNEAGRLIAAKGLVLRDETQAEAPAGFMDRLQDRLDDVSEVRQRVHHHAPARRMTAIAAAGAIAVSVALILSTSFFMRTDRALDLAQIHQQLLAGAPRGAVADGFTPISCDPRRDNWEQMQRALVQIDGTLIGYSLFRVGNCPVSVFEGPYAWEPYRPGGRDNQRIEGVDVRQIGNQSMTTWQHSAHRYVLTASGPPELIPGLVRAYMRTQGRSSGL